MLYKITCKMSFTLSISYVCVPCGGPDGEIGASMRYLSQRFSMPNRMATAVLNDVGTEELAHLEMVSTIVHQLTRNLSMEEIKIPVSGLIILTTQLASGRRQQAVFLLMPVSSSQKAIPLPICLKIWQQMVRLCKDNIEVLKDSSR